MRREESTWKGYTLTQYDLPSLHLQHMGYTWFECSKIVHYFMQTKLSMSVTLVGPQVNPSLDMQPLQLFLTKGTWRASGSHTTFHCVANPQTVETEVAQINQVREAEVKQISVGLTRYLTSSGGVSSPHHLPNPRGSHTRNTGSLLEANEAALLFPLTAHILVGKRWELVTEVRCNTALQVKRRVLASESLLLPAPYLCVQAPSVLHHHGAWAHIKHFPSYKRLKDTHSSCILFSTPSPQRNQWKSGKFAPTSDLPLDITNIRGWEWVCVWQVKKLRGGSRKK